MPEGPSIIIAKEKFREFEGKKIIAVAGNAKIDLSRLENKKIISFKSWGKHLLICFSDFTVRVHFLMFGTYLVNERKSTPLKLGLEYKDGELNLYTCNVKILEGEINSHYDWSADVMNENWSAPKAKRKLKEIPDTQIADALMEQELFSGVGNIIKNEVLYRVRVHPESIISEIPTKKINEILKETVAYSFDFLKWKNENTLKKHWLIYHKKACENCGLPIVKKETGKKKRASFFCKNCQVKYD